MKEKQPNKNQQSKEQQKLKPLSTNTKQEQPLEETESTEQLKLSVEELRNKEHLTEDEFLELVMFERDEAIARERVRRQQNAPPPKKLPRQARLFVWLISAALVISLFASFAGAFNIPALEFVKTSAKLYADEDVRTYKEAIVEVRTPGGKGTGFAITKDGYILTNEHIIENETNITVSFSDAGIYPATIVEENAAIDLALLKIDGQDLPTLQLSEEALVEEEQDILFIGNPLSYSFIANEGMTIGEILLQDWTENVWMIDAPIYKGNSGSPVLNEAGEVIGVVFATTKTKNYGKVGLFVPIATFYEYFPVWEQQLLQ